MTTYKNLDVHQGFPGEIDGDNKSLNKRRELGSDSNSPAGQKILAKYGFSAPSARSTSVPESQNLGGILLAVGIGLALKKTSTASKKRKLKKVITCCY